MKTIKLKERGITLIALVITIVVLIILATISINMILDDNGIIGAAELAKEKYQNAAQKEKEDMYGLEEYVEESVGIVPTVEELQSRYEFEYYSSMVAAVNDVNNGTIGENTIANKEEAIAGIYTNKGNTYVVLLKSTKEETRVQTSVDMTINLGGYELSSDNAVGIEIGSGSSVTIDGRLEGSTINITHTDGTGARPIQALENSKLIINGGKYISNSNEYSKPGAAIYIKGEASISNAVIEATETTGNNIGIQVIKTGSIKVSNCNITALSTDGEALGIQISNADNVSTMTNCNIKATSTNSMTRGVVFDGSINTSNCDIQVFTTNGTAYGICNSSDSTVNISNCNIKAYSNYTSDGVNYQAFSHGVINDGNLTINDCYVMGTHSGVSNEGKLYVNGGIYEGYGHGGFYFEGTGTTSWVRNATIRECTMPEGYTATAQDNNAGFYIGGAEGNDNIKVYMDNCNIYGSVQPIVLRGTSGEKNNSLYISNSKINTDKKIRIDNDTHKLYIGVGNNFTADNTNRPSVVETTNETYIKAE